MRAARPATGQTARLRRRAKQAVGSAACVCGGVRGPSRLKLHTVAARPSRGFAAMGADDELLKQKKGAVLHARAALRRRSVFAQRAEPRLTWCALSLLRSAHGRRRRHRLRAAEDAGAERLRRHPDGAWQAAPLAFRSCVLLAADAPRGVGADRHGHDRDEQPKPPVPVPPAPRRQVQSAGASVAPPRGPSSARAERVAARCCARRRLPARPCFVSAQTRASWRTTTT